MVCARHAELNPDYGTCSPMHWPAGGPSHYAHARREAARAKRLRLLYDAKAARLIGMDKIATRLEAEARALAEAIDANTKGPK